MPTKSAYVLPVMKLTRKQRRMSQRMVLLAKTCMRWLSMGWRALFNKKFLRMTTAALAFATTVAVSAPGVGASGPVSSLGSSFRVNQTTFGNQDRAKVAVDGDGDYVVVWGDNYQGIMARRFNAAGTAQGGEFSVTFDNSDPAVAMDATGNFVVVWSASDSSGTGILAQRFDAAGNKVGNRFLVNQQQSGNQSDPDVAMDADGDFVVTWQSPVAELGFTSYNYQSGITARLFDAEGQPKDDEFLVNTSQYYNQVSARVAMDRDGDFVVTWQSDYNDGDDWGVVAQKFDKDGQKVGGEIQVNQFYYGFQGDADVAMDADGDFVVTWNSSYYAGYSSSSYWSYYQSDVMMRRFSSNGTPQGDEVFVAQGNIANGASIYVFEPSVGMDADGDFVVAWRREDSDNNTDTIHARAYYANGSANGGEIAVSNTSFDQTNPDVAMDPRGNFVVVREGETIGDSSGVTARQYVMAGGDDAAPFVGGVYLVGNKSPITEGERIAVRPSELVVTFSEEMDENQLEATGSWILERDGGDVSAEIDSVGFAFNSTTNRWEALITFTGALMDGQYTLSLRDDVEDTTGNSLDGDYDGPGGGWFVRHFEVARAVPIGPQTNANVGSADSYQDAAVAMDADGDYVVVWAETRTFQDSTYSYSFRSSYSRTTGVIKAQLYYADGSANGPAFDVSAPVSDLNTTPDVAMDADGNFVITWVNAVVSTSYTSLYFGSPFSSWQPGLFTNSTYSGTAQVYFRRYDNDGSPQTPSGVPLGSTFTPESQPAAAMDRDGDFVIVWSDWDGDITGQRFNEDGNAQGSSIQVNTVTGVSHTNPDVAMDDTGNFVVVWQDGTYLTPRVRARRFAADGAGSTVIAVSTVNFVPNVYPSVAMDSDGDFVVAWDTYQLSISGYSATIKGFDAAGYETFFTTAAANAQSNRPEIAMDDDGDFVVTWNQGGDIRGLRFSADGTAEGSVFTANTFASGTQRDPAIAIDNDGDFVVAWAGAVSSNGSSYLYYGVAHRRYNRNEEPTFNGFAENPVIRNEDAADELIDLTAVFNDSTDDWEPTDVSFSVVDNDNTSLLTASVSGTTLTLDFAPDANGSAVITVRCTDSSGKITDETLNVTVNPVNDAPVLTPDTPDMTSVDEDDSNPSGDLVSAIVGSTITDVDASAVEGIAIVAADSTDGDWEYDNGGGWTALPAVAADNALLLRATDKVRFVPDAAFEGSATITYHAWDQTSGSSGGTVDLTVVGATGGTTAFSTATDVATVDIIPGNNSPVLDNSGSPTLTAVTEDDTNPAGDLVSAIVGTSITDADAGALEGIAITAADEANGQWQYDIGSGWVNFPAVAADAALLLDAGDKIRFVPDADYDGSATITYKAWDQTSGSAGSTADTTVAGLHIAFSSASETATVDVLPVNDAPVLTAASPSFTTDEDAATPTPVLVSAILGSSVTDADTGAVSGIAIYASTSEANGDWQYSISAGATWYNFPAISAANSLLLRSTDLVRFAPAANYEGSATFSYRAWDQTGVTAGMEGTTADTSVNGGASPFSSGTDTVTIDVLPSNEAPVLTPHNPYMDDVSQGDSNPPGDLVGDLIADSIEDYDVGALEGIAVTGALGNPFVDGKWQYKLDGTLGWLDFPACSTGNALMLRPEDRVRFRPLGSTTGLFNFDYVAWDQTAGTAGNTASTIPWYGSSPFSDPNTVIERVYVNVIDYNDPPVLNTSGAPMFTSVVEDDTNPAGDTVASIVGASISDADPTPLEGIAVTYADTANGTWEFSLNGGTSWNTVPAVAGYSGLLLRDVDMLRFVPNANFNGTSTIMYCAWDQTGATAGLEGTQFDTTPSATGPFSTAVETATVTVTPVNDAPVLTASAPSLTSIAEDDTNSAGDTIAAIVGSSIDDADAGALEGIAIYAAVANPGTEGKWQYKLVAGSWTDFPAIAPATALLLRPTDRVRFVPVLDFIGSKSFSFRAWDQTSGSAGSTADVSTNGLATPFSTGTDTATITVTAVNDAPVLDNSGSPTLPSVVEDVTNPAGTTIAAIVGASISDVDAGALEGIAVFNVDNTNGAWQYSHNGGLSWNSFAGVGFSAAVLLRDTDLMRFVPAANFNGTATFDYLAWDRTQGSAGISHNLASNGIGGITAFSSAAETASITVTPANDRPVMVASSPSLTSVDEDTAAPAGDLVSGLLGASVSDIDGDLPGMAITAVTGAGNGTWQYNIGSGWVNFPAVSSSAALLLRDIDSVRYVPNANYNGSATFSYKAWDQTSGTQGTTADTAVGNTFSTLSNTASVTINAVNDAPTLTAFGPTLIAVIEDSTNPAGNSVAGILSSSMADIDAGAVRGIAITSADITNGSWQYSLNGGGWTNFPAVVGANALLLRDVDSIRFIPDANFDGSATITYRAWDRTTGSAGSTADATIAGGATAFSTASDTGTVNITPVNDRPVLTAAAPALTDVTEDDTDPAGDIVSSFVAASITDDDSGDPQGIAITGRTGTSNGTWQYDIGGGWVNFPAVSAASALLLPDTAVVRFVPNMHYFGTASITYRAWDQTTGSAGATANVSVGTAFSAGSDTATVEITPLNEAPVLDNSGSPVLSTIAEDTANPAGNTVMSIVGATISDIDTTDARGIAIIAADAANGTWQYSADGTIWTNIGTPALNNALLLRDTDHVRFVPSANYNGTATITYHAWDRTAGTAGSSVDLSGGSATGGNTAYSSASDVATITVTAVNDSPVLTPNTNNLSDVAEDDNDPAGDDVASLLGASVSDVDAGATQGIAVTGFTGAANGTWQFSTDAGANWTDVPSVSGSNALLLRDVDLLRYVPNTDFNGTATVTYLAWDRTVGTAGTTYNVFLSDAFSVGSDTASVDVTAVNDAPVMNTIGAPVFSDVDEDDTDPAGDTVASLIGSSISDVDAGAQQGIAVTAADTANGTWQFSIDGGANWIDAPAVSMSGALLLRNVDMLRFVPNNYYNGTAHLSYVAWDRTTGTQGNQVDISGGSATGGTTAFGTGSETATVTVRAINDAPVLAVGSSPRLGTIVSDNHSPGGATLTSLIGTSITDIDAGAVEGVAVVGVTGIVGGQWQYSLDGGASWTPFPTVATSAALLLRDTDRVRFVPFNSFGGTATVQYRAWDRTSGNAGDVVDLSGGSATGGTTAFSVEEETAVIDVIKAKDDDGGGCATTTSNSAPWGLLAVLFALFGSMGFARRKRE